MKLGAPEPIAALNRVRIVESGEPLVDVRDFCPEVEVAERACPYLRSTVAEMLNRAQSSLPRGLRLRASTCLRTLSMQRAGWDGYFARMKAEHPEWPLSALRRATNRYFAPYDQPAPPGHCTGGAVDVAILGPDGEALDVTSPTQGWEAAYTWSDRISPEAKANRMLLVNAMLGAGFSNCREEYWHYSYGDSAWAVRVGERECPYGLVEPPHAVEARFAGGAAEIHRAGERAWVLRPAEDAGGAARLLAGVFWAEGMEVALRIEWAGHPPPGFWTSPDRENWSPVAVVEAGSAFLLTLTPETPRVYLSSTPPPEPPAQAG